jgi:hypothetical protein
LTATARPNRYSIPSPGTVPCHPREHRLSLFWAEDLGHRVHQRPGLPGRGGHELVRTVDEFHVQFRTGRGHRAVELVRAEAEASM